MDNSFVATNKGKQVLQWLLNRGISENVINEAGLKWNDTHIEIPIRDAAGYFLFNKNRRDPERTIGPKYSYDTGSKTALYGADQLSKSDLIIVCEGELDALLLRSRGFFAVSSTGGAGTFLPEWGALFAGKEVWVVFDNDDAGLNGSVKVCRIIPHAKLVRLPRGVGDHGDITDYFKTRDDEQFRRLLATGEVLPPLPRPRAPRKSSKKVEGTAMEKAKAYPIYRLLHSTKPKKIGFFNCPIHREKHGSLKVYPDNRWYCFGACQKGGDTIDFVMLRDDISMKDAVALILTLE